MQGSPYESEIVQRVKSEFVPASEPAPAVQGMVLTATELSDVTIHIDTCACDNCTGIEGPRSGESHLQLSGISEESVQPPWTVACTMVISGPAGTAEILTPIKRAHYLPSLRRRILISGSWLAERGITLETGAYGAPSYLLYPAHPLTGERPRIRCDFIDGVLQVTDPRVQLRSGVQGPKVWYAGPAGDLPTTAAALQPSTETVPAAAAPVPKLRSVFAALSTSSEPSKSQLKRRRQREARASQPPAPPAAPAPTPLPASPNGSVAATGVPPASDALECISCDHPISKFEPHVKCTSGLDNHAEPCTASMHSTCTPPAGSRYIGRGENFVCATCVSAFVTMAMDARAAAAATAGRMVLKPFAEANAAVSESMERPESPDDLCDPACNCTACAHVSGANIAAGPELTVPAAAELNSALPTPAPTGSGAQNLSSMASAPMPTVPGPNAQLGMDTIVGASAQPAIVLPAVASRRRTIAEVIAGGAAEDDDDEPPGLVSASSDSDNDRRHNVRRTGRIFMAIQSPAHGARSARASMPAGGSSARCEADCTCQTCTRTTGRNVFARHDPQVTAASRFRSELPTTTAVASVAATEPASVLAPMLAVAGTNLRRGVPTFADTAAPHDIGMPAMISGRCAFTADAEDDLEGSDDDLPGLVDSSSESESDQWQGVRRNGGDVYLARGRPRRPHSRDPQAQCARPLPQAPSQQRPPWEVRTLELARDARSESTTRS